jgi:hypothetical protein
MYDSSHKTNASAIQYLNQSASLHCENAVRVDNRVQAVSNRDDRAVRKRLAQGLLDEKVRVLIERRGRLVEHEHGRLAQKGARQAEQLTAKETRTTFRMKENG